MMKNGKSDVVDEFYRGKLEGIEGIALSLGQSYVVSKCKSTYGNALPSRCAVLSDLLVSYLSEQVEELKKLRKQVSLLNRQIEDMNQMAFEFLREESS